MKTVLIAEDEEAIREFVVINLRHAGYTVLQAENGQQALEIFQAEKDIDVVLLDIMMPYVDGVSVCKQIRETNPHVGIIMLTAKTQESDKVTGLLSGADDYVTKPFSVSELMARVDAIYRRVSVNHHTETQDVFQIEDGAFLLNLRNRTLKKDGEIIDLTQVEFKIMECFLRNSGKSLTRSDIQKYVWGADEYSDEKIVDVNIRRLRMKIEVKPSTPEHIVTIWRVGYKWVS